MKILIAGFQHETNTFAPTRADWSAFLRGDSFPAFVRGQALIDAFTGVNIPIGGFIDAANEAGWSLLPSLWAGATPSAHVTADAFDRISGMLLEDTRRALAGKNLAAIYLDLHGAAVAEQADDAEGELLARLRELTGPDLPIIVSLDLHANVTDRMFELADALVAYRTYPHVDMAQTGRLAAGLLRRRLALGRREPLYSKRVPFLLSLPVQSTMTEPAQGIYQRLAELSEQTDTVLSFAMGFPAADFAECGPRIWAHGERAREAVDALFAIVDQPREQWRARVLSPEEAVREAMDLAAGADKPVVIADTQDNPGAGGDSNTTGMLRALLAQGAGKRFPGQIAIGMVWDSAAAAAAHEAGEGAEIEIEIGTSVRVFGDQFSEPPVRGRFRVRRLGAAQVTLKGPMMTGVVNELGRSACLEIDGVQVAVASGKVQLLDRELYRAVGIEPEAMKILVNKSSVHFRADFTPIASQILVAKAPGPMAADPADLPWTKLPDSVALAP